MWAMITTFLPVRVGVTFLKWPLQKSHMNKMNNHLHVKCSHISVFIIFFNKIIFFKKRIFHDDVTGTHKVSGCKMFPY